MENIEKKLEMLDDLRKECNEYEKELSGKQDDSKLIQFLNEEYPKLKKNGLKEILKIVAGKKKPVKISNERKKEIEKTLIAKSFMCDINPLNKQGKFIGFDKLRQRIAAKKSLLKRNLSKEN